MRTRVLVFAGILLVLSHIAAAQLSYKETDKIALNVSAFDPDADALRIAYSAPLNEKGEWQTTYGDAGVYTINVTVTDGTLSSSEEVVMLVNRKDEPPEITSHRPRSGMMSIREGKSLSFSASATDKNNDALEYVWAVDGKNTSTGPRFTYSTQYTDQGSHSIVLYINDGILTTTRTWEIQVRDVDLDALLLSQYKDITILENEVVRVPLPDAVFYGVQYTFSSPLENGYWKTNYNSSGLYKVVVHVFGKGYDGKKTFRIRVLNVDQKPVISPIPAQSIEEGKEISFAVLATDPDNDKVLLALNRPPEGASISNKIFRWTPSFDEVRRTGLTSGIARSLHLLSKPVELEFVATSNNQSTTLSVPLTIFNTNRAPRIHPPASITLHEGDLFNFDVNATDPDNDPLDISYDSTLKRGSAVGFDLAGSHALKVIASDGFLQDTAHIPITVENTNRAPTLSLPPTKATENQSLMMELGGKDEDNDPLTYSLIDGPKGMQITGSILSWTPGFDVASASKQVVFATIQASDGLAETSANATIEVSNANRAPVLNEPSTQKLTAQRGMPITLKMNATDFDKDPLSYTWRFGWFDSYTGGSSHARTFVAKGQKTVTVTATDGQKSIKKKMLITVI